MKVPAKNYAILPDWPAEPGRGIPTWTVVRKADGKVVWRGKKHKSARTAHAQRELGIPYRDARRMGNC